MSQREELMQEALNDENYEEEWTVVMNTRGRYSLSKNQARLVQEALARSERGAIVFKTFAIPIPYIAEFFREKRLLKANRTLPEPETQYIPMADEKWKKLKEDIYKKIGKPL